MIIGLLTVSLHLPTCTSLKEKRRLLVPLKSRLSSNFNVSVAEVDEQDKWQKATLAVVHVGITKPVVNSVISRIVNAVEEDRNCQLLDYEMELIK